MGTFLSTETIVSLENKLPDNFLRIHRGIILNKDYIKEARNTLPVNISLPK
jgi:DNA-binding LytR/AlgR family response regulator